MMQDMELKRQSLGGYEMAWTLIRENWEDKLKDRLGVYDPENEEYMNPVTEKKVIEAIKLVTDKLTLLTKSDDIGFSAREFQDEKTFVNSVVNAVHHARAYMMLAKSSADMYGAFAYGYPAPKRSRIDLLKSANRDYPTAKYARKITDYTEYALVCYWCYDVLANIDTVAALSNEVKAKLHSALYELEDAVKSLDKKFDIAAKSPDVLDWI